MMTPPSIGATTRAVIADVGRRASSSAAAASNASGSPSISRITITDMPTSSANESPGAATAYFQASNHGRGWLDLGTRTALVPNQGRARSASGQRGYWAGDVAGERRAGAEAPAVAWHGPGGPVS